MHSPFSSPKITSLDQVAKTTLRGRESGLFPWVRGSLLP